MTDTVEQLVERRMVEVNAKTDAYARRYVELYSDFIMNYGSDHEMVVRTENGLPVFIEARCLHPYGRGLSDMVKHKR